MNNPEETALVQWLFLDLNAYFASCEQQENPALRDKPIIIVQTLTETACAIASSYEAKRLGITTGTLVREARRLCPEVIPVKAKHALYAAYHQRILKAVDTCLPVEKVLSVDEMACRLMGDERELPRARALALKVKRALRERVGERMTCSIGLAPNIFLGKVGSDLQKPDGLVVLTKDLLPGPMLGMALQDIYGIGPRMEQRLNRFGIYNVADLWGASSDRLRRVWGGINGVAFYETLHGADLHATSSAYAKSMGHQHVLEPELRTWEGAKNFSFHLLTKAAERLRRNAYYCRKLGLGVFWCGGGKAWWDETSFQETSDTQFLRARLENVWARVPSFKPLMVSVVLLDLVPEHEHQPDLFSQNPRREKLSSLIDQINQRYGRNTVSYGVPLTTTRSFRGHAAFRRVPEAWEF